MNMTDPREIEQALHWVSVDLRARVRALWWIPPANILTGLIATVLGAYLAWNGMQEKPVLLLAIYWLGAAMNAWSAYLSLRTAQRELGIWIVGWLAIRQLRRALARYMSR